MVILINVVKQPYLGLLDILMCRNHNMSLMDELLKIMFCSLSFSFGVLWTILFMFSWSVLLLLHLWRLGLDVFEILGSKCLGNDYKYLRVNTYGWKLVDLGFGRFGLKDPGCIKGAYVGRNSRFSLNLATWVHVDLWKLCACQKCYFPNICVFYLKIAMVEFME